MSKPAENKKLEGKVIDVAPIHQQEKNPIDGLRKQMDSQRTEFKLPAHISFDKFQRTVMTACVQNPSLLQADRRSLLLSCVRAATDGLLPDGREAALVIFNTKIKDLDGKEKWVNAVQYMPMTFGILKKVRQSGEISMVVAHVVYQKDYFTYILGDEERVEHKPYTGIEDRGPIIASYAIAKFKDGSIQREVMTVQDIEKIRKVSKSGAVSSKDIEYNKTLVLGDPKGIWLSWYEEMARKTVFRRLAKWLPQAIDKDGQDALFSNDETMDTIDAVTPDAATSEKPAALIHQTQAQLTDESGQPDLGEMIDASKAKQEAEDEQKVPVGEVENPKKEASKKVAKPEVETEKEPAKETEKPLPTMIETIVAAIDGAQDDGELDGIWNVEFAKEIGELSKPDLEKANAAYSAAVKRFNQE